MTRSFFTFLFLLFATAASASGVYVFIGSYNGDKDKAGIYVYRLDTASGNLKFITSVKVHNPSYLTLSADGKYVYACTETKTAGKGSVSSFSFNEQRGKLTFINKQSSEGENPVYLNIDKTGKWLVDANYTQAGLSVYPLNADGSIGDIAQHFIHTGSSVNKERQEASHLHAAVFSPDGKKLFVPDLGSDKIWNYDFDAGKAKPLSPYLPKQFYVTSVGTGPRHLCFHPNGEFLYCTEELTGTFSVYHYMQGFLSQWMQLPTQKSNEDLTPVSTADIHLSPDGKFLYISNRANKNNISIFAISEDGMLDAVGLQPSLGDHPRSLAIDDSGKFLIVANQVSGDLVVFRRNMETGKLSQAGKQVTLLEPSCVKIQCYK